MKLIYDVDDKNFRGGDGTIKNGFVPQISYGESAIWEIDLVSDNGITINSITGWRAAIDTDFTSTTTPMARTTTGITATAITDGISVTVPIETLTQRFQTVCDGKPQTQAYFELAGLDSNGRTIFYVRFGILCIYPIDAQAAGTVTPVSCTTMTTAQVNAIAAGATSSVLSGYATKSYVNSAISATTAYVDSAISSISVTSGGSNYATTAYVDSAIASIPVTSGGTVDLTNYATKAFVSSAIAAIPVASGSSVDLSSYATTSALNSAISAVSASIPSLSSYATTAYVDSAISGISVGTSAAAPTYVYSSTSYSNTYNGGTYVWDSTTSAAICESTNNGSKRRIICSTVNGYTRWRVQVYSSGSWVNPTDAGFISLAVSGSITSDINSICGVNSWYNEDYEMGETVTIVASSSLTELRQITNLVGGIYPGRAYYYNMSTSWTPQAHGGSSGYTGESELFINCTGGELASGGTNITIVNQPTVGKTNFCVVKWNGVDARLYVVDSY